jgi:hypothetical protein
MLKFIIKDSFDQFILGGDNSNDIITVLVLIIFSYFFAFFYVEVPGDFREEDSKGDNYDTPGVVDEIPNAWSVFLDSYKLRT